MDNDSANEDISELTFRSSETTLLFSGYLAAFDIISNAEKQKMTANELPFEDHKLIQRPKIEVNQELYLAEDSNVQFGKDSLHYSEADDDTEHPLVFRKCLLFNFFWHLLKF